MPKPGVPEDNWEEVSDAVEAAAGNWQKLENKGGTTKEAGSKQLKPSNDQRFTLGLSAVLAAQPARERARAIAAGNIQNPNAEPYRPAVSASRPTTPSTPGTRNPVVASVLDTQRAARLAALVRQQSEDPGAKGQDGGSGLYKKKGSGLATQIGAFLDEKGDKK